MFSLTVQLGPAAMSSSTDRGAGLDRRQFRPPTREHHIEDTAALKTNPEAAEEIARQRCGCATSPG